MENLQPPASALPVLVGFILFARVVFYGFVLDFRRIHSCNSCTTACKKLLLTHSQRHGHRDSEEEGEENRMSKSRKQVRAGLTISPPQEAKL